MKSKKTISILISTAVMAGVMPAYAAHTASTFDEATRKYFYSNTYDSSSIEKGNLGFDVSVADDPKDSTNKVMLIKDSDAKGGAQNAFNTISLSGLSDGWANTPTYTTKGIDQNKLLIAETDIYLPSGLLDELVSFSIGLPGYTQVWNSSVIGAINVTKESDTGFLFTTGSNTKSIAADSWYNIKYTYNITTGDYKSYIDEELFASGRADSWLLPGMDAVFMGIKIRSRGNTITADDGTVSYETPITAGFYIDNSAVYQYVDQTVEYSIEDGAVDVSLTDPITVTFGCNVDATKLTGLFEAAAADGSKITGNVSQAEANSVNVSFDGLQDSTAYTLSFAGYSEGEIVFPSGSVTFTTQQGPRVDEKTYMISNDIEASSLGESAWLSDAVVARTSDPTGRSGYVMKYTTAGNLTQTNNARGFTSRADFSPNGAWGTKKYSEFGMTDDKTLFASADFYLPKAALDELTSDGYYTFCLGAVGVGDRYGFGNLTIKKSEDGAAFTVSSKNSQTIIAPDTWFTVSYVYQPGSYNVKIYINNQLLDDITGENTWFTITSATTAAGIRVITPQGTVITDGIYIDNISIWQIKNKIGIDSVEFDGQNQKVKVNFATSINESELSKVQMTFNGTDVTSLITAHELADNAYEATLTVDYSSMALASDYTIELPTGFTDINGQIAMENVRAVFTTPKSRNVYIKSYTLTAPTSTGAAVNVILDTVKAEAENAWVVMAVYGNYNELIAIDDTTVTADGETTVDLSVSSDCSAAKEVRIYVWNSPNNMVPLQKNEIVWTAAE